MDDLEAVRKHFGLERVTLVGHSWGAGVAALYAMRYPDRVSRMVLIGPMARDAVRADPADMTKMRGDVCAAAEWTAAFPNARLLLLEGVGHFPCVEAPEAFFPAIEAFLRGQWPEEAQSTGP